MSYLFPETGTRKIWYQIACQMLNKPVPVFWYGFSRYQIACQMRQKPVPIFWYGFLLLISDVCYAHLTTYCTTPVCLHLSVPV